MGQRLLGGVDVALAAFFLLVAQWAVWVQETVPGPKLLDTVVLAFVAPPLAFRRRLPTAAVAVSAGAIATQALLVRSTPDGLLYVGPMIVLAYSTGRHVGDRVRLLAVGCCFAAALSLQAAFDASAHTSAQRWAGAFWAPVLAAAWLTGAFVRARAQNRAAVAAETARRGALEAERLRIARELHDVLAHSVSLMGVQAAAADRVLSVDPERARPALQSIQQISRDSVGELRRLLEMLRARDDAARRPQPRLAEIRDLVAQAEAAGLPVTLDVHGDLAELPPGIELSAYRIVQEALTNALKHARPSTVEIVLRRSRDGLELEVLNDGVLVADDSNRSGFGLVGARERASVYGGDLSAVREPGGRFRVRAILPVGGAA